MRRIVCSVLFAVALATPMVLAGFDRPTDAIAAPPGDVIPGQYIVTLKPGEKPATVGNRLALGTGLSVRHRFSHAINGFSATIPPARLQQVRNDPSVLSVIEDRIVTIATDTRPTGIQRSEADRNAVAQIGSHSSPISVDVAVIDTGVTAGHPDLNVVGGVNCVPGESSWEDQHGHGTHVAGTIGALDNASGVVGVAPGARIWAVRVLNAQGEGTFSNVICGVDWVTANAHIIDVANMSLGAQGSAGGCADGGLHQAVCTSVEAGVTYVVAAGNSGMDASAFVPAAFPEVITVSALADTDGKPGGLGPHSFLYGADDTLATFSNYGGVVDIAAPGVNILSTWLGGSYNTISGTSMASPHVAGAAAIFLFRYPGSSPAAVRSHILSEAWEQSSPQGFTGDPDGSPEPLLNVGTIGGLDPLPPPPPPAAGCNLTIDSGVPGSQTTITCSGYQAGEWVWLYWDSVALGTKGLFIASGSGDGAATMTIPNAPYGEHQILAIGATSGIEASLPFNVIPSVTLGSSSGKVGSLLFIYVKGFAAIEPVDIRWHSTDGSSTTLKTATTSAAGNINTYVSVPEGSAGSYIVEAAGISSGASGSGEYSILPSLKLSPTSGRVGANVTATVSGHHAGETVDIRWDGITVASGVADSLGKTAIAFTVPESPAGARNVESVGSGGSLASVTYTVIPSLTLTPTRGPVGSQADVVLAGFGAGETVQIDWYETTSTSTVLTTFTTSAFGSVSASFDVPASVSGYHRVVATGLSSGKSVSSGYTVVSSIELSPAAGMRDQTITATMHGYAANEALNVSWYESQYAGEIVGSASTSNTGTATLTFQVPANTSYGDHKVESVSASGQGKTSTVFTVEGVDGPVQASCEVSPESGQVGSRVTVECYGFQPGEYIRVYWDTTTSSQKLTFRALNGSGSGMMTIPDATTGEHTLIGVGTSSGATANVGFVVLPGITLNTASGTGGSYVSATAQGFAAGETVSFIWHDGTSATVVKTATASSTGRASSLIPVPTAAGGTYWIEAIGQTSGGTSSATFTVTPAMKLSRTSGTVGTILTVTITGFGDGDVADIFWDDQAQGTIAASANGSGTLEMTVPAAQRGAHLVSAIDESGNVIETVFQILPAMSQSTKSAAVGEQVFLNLTGYTAGETVEIRWYDTSTTYTVIATTTASPVGSASLHVTVPEAVNGYHALKATGLQSQSTASGNVSVAASIVLSISHGGAGATVTATMTGFKASESMSLNWYSSSFVFYAIEFGTSSELGSATITFTVPADASPGGYKVEARGATGFPRASTVFTVS